MSPIYFPYSATLEATAGGPRRPRVRVWDLPTRLFHWLLVALVGLAWVTSDMGGLMFTIHVAAGLGVVTLILFRVVWGFVGGRHARFRDFLRPRPVVRAYLGRVLRLSPPHTVGHNPLGGWMVVLLLATLAALAATGLFGAHHSDVAPLAHLLPRGVAHASAEIHEGIAGFLGFLVGVHLLGVLYHAVVGRENLTRAMWTGVKMAPGAASTPTAAGPAVVGLWRAALALTASVCLVWVVLA